MHWPGSNVRLLRQKRRCHRGRCRRQGAAENLHQGAEADRTAHVVSGTRRTCRQVCRNGAHRQLERCQKGCCGSRGRAACHRAEGATCCEGDQAARTRGRVGREGSDASCACEIGSAGWRSGATSRRSGTARADRAGGARGQDQERRPVDLELHGELVRKLLTSFAEREISGVPGFTDFCCRRSDPGLRRRVTIGWETRVPSGDTSARGQPAALTHCDTFATETASGAPGPGWATWAERGTWPGGR